MHDANGAGASASRADERDLRSGELATLAGVSTDTLRHYERKGVLAAPRRLANGYRSYPAAALQRVLVIRAALAVGFSLDELRPLLRARDRGRAPCRSVRDMAAQKLAAAESELAALAQRTTTLRALLGEWDSRLETATPGEPLRLLDTLPAATPGHLHRRAPPPRPPHPEDP